MRRNRSMSMERFLRMRLKLPGSQCTLRASQASLRSCSFSTLLTDSPISYSFVCIAPAVVGFPSACRSKLFYNKLNIRIRLKPGPRRNYCKFGCKNILLRSFPTIYHVTEAIRKCNKIVSQNELLQTVQKICIIVEQNGLHHGEDATLHHWHRRL